MYDVFEELLKERGVRAADVAREADVPPSTFSDWKKGKSKPKNEKLAKIANYFKIDLRIFKNKNPHGLCYDCGLNYVAGYKPDELEHKKYHNAWENAVKKFGFCWPYAVRENAKAIARNKLLREDLTLKERTDANIEIMKALFSRSLEASKYDLEHVDFATYVAMLLNQNQFKEKIENDVYNELVKQYGIKEGIEDGKTYYIVPSNRQVLHDTESKPEYGVNTVAAHRDDDEDWTPEELQKIEEYKQLLKAARKSMDKS